MQDFEKLGVFYLGKEYDITANKLSDSLVLYDAKDLTTHAVCVGMTGSGKTGLCISLLEEAAIDGIPALIIDPKGDIGNLLLTFPELKPADFRPWLEATEATRKGLTLDQLAEKTAAQWRDGLHQWGQDGERIARFRDAVDLTIYTPGSTAGMPLTLLKSFAAPSATVLANDEAFRDRVNGAVSGLLALLGIEADPIRSREHTLLANILDRAWREKRDLSMEQLLREIHTPPFDKIGFLDLESVFPINDRFALASSLNNLLASPGFQAWMSGEPLDIQRLLYTTTGKPRHSILSIAHLSDAERMFFVTIVLNELIAWMRQQSGTSSLRAILYMDEIFGYFPPTANPPSKTPLLTLMKQARAFGVGVLLATQNPVDIDYKGLSNAGTWLLGRLQTERDKARVLDGLEGASAASGADFDRPMVERLLSGLGNRVFLMNNVHDDQPTLFQTRWALSFLRGPLTRDQIAMLMSPQREELPKRSGPIQQTADADKQAGARPLLPPDIPELFADAPRHPRSSGTPVYHPGLVGFARVHFVQSSAGIDHWEDLVVSVTTNETWSVDNAWASASITIGEKPDVEDQPVENARFASVPPELTRVKTYKGLAAELKNYLYRNHVYTVWKCAAVKLTSMSEESEGDFRARVALAMREQRDLALSKIQLKYAPKFAALTEQLRKAEQRLQKEKEQSSHQTMQTVISVGSSIVAALFGRKLKSVSNVNRASTGMRGIGRVMSERADVGRAEDNTSAIQERIDALDVEFKTESEKIQTLYSIDSVEIEATSVKPRKSDISVSQIALIWTSH